MPATAIIQTDLLERDLDPEAEELNSRHGITRDRDWLFLDYSPRDDSDFIRGVGLNVRTGRLMAGNIQFDETPPEARIDRFGSAELSGTNVYASIMFELERLFRKPSSMMELQSIYSAEKRSTEDVASPARRAAFVKWFESYVKDVNVSKLGKPRIEGDYSSQLSKKAFKDRLRQQGKLTTPDPYTPDYFRTLYGKRIFDLLQQNEVGETWG